MFVGLAYGSPSISAGWTLNPFASEKPKAKPHPTSMTKQPPGALEKVGTGTKNLFNKTGETLGLKKPQPKKAPPVVAAKPRTVPAPYSEKKGLLSWFAPKNEKPKTVKGWIETTKQVTP